MMAMKRMLALLVVAACVAGLVACHGMPSKIDGMTSDPSAGAPTQELSGYYLQEGAQFPCYWDVLPVGEGTYRGMFIRYIREEPDLPVWESRSDILEGYITPDGALEFCCSEGFIRVAADASGTLTLTPEGEGLADLAGRYCRVAALPQLSYTLPQPPAYAADPRCSVPMDTTLAAAVRAALGLPADALLDAALLDQVTDLMVFEEPITSLTGVSSLHNLRCLRISRGYITDITELTRLTRLEQVDIAWCYIRTIPDLSACYALRELRLDANCIEDIAPVATAPGLRFVSLGSNRIRSVAPLAGCSDLEFLVLEGNCILDYAAVAGNPALVRAIDEGNNFTFAAALATERLAQETAAAVTAGLESALEKEAAIYRHIIETTEPAEGNYREACYGERVLRTHRGVCGNYAEAFALLCGHAGVWAETCTSEDHQWNLVRIDGEVYHCDALWDEGYTDWQYFNRGTGYILTQPNHHHDLLRYPECVRDMDVLRATLARQTAEQSFEVPECFSRSFGIR